ncbi:hypothetical protein Dimus_028241 [Dionaea muscipula]
MAADPPQRVRVVAKIRASANPETRSVKRVQKPWISVHRPEDSASARVRISFGDQSTGGKQQIYEVDDCYGEDAGNGVVFEKEIRPLICQVLEGRNATVFAYGAKGSGKTFTIQGTEDEPGLVAMAVTEILSRAEEVGRSVSVSLYVVHQERIIDLLDSKRSEVSVFEDARCKIRLRGLCEVNVKSVSEFMNLYFGGANVCKPLLYKVGNKAYQRHHRGLIVHVLPSPNETQGGLVVGKLNFVDLAACEDSRKEGIDGTNLFDITRTNKSLYAVQKVVHALSVGDVHVPYRESKLTHMLQDSLGCTSRILMVTCMNPFFCEDTIKALSSTCRLCQASHLEIARRGKSTTRPILSSSIKSIKSVTSSVPTKKQARPLLPISKEGAKSAAIEAKGRRFFDEENQLKTSEQENSLAIVVSDDQPSQNVKFEEVNSASDVVLEEQPSQLVLAEEAYIPTIEEDLVMPTPVAYHSPIAADFPFKDKENKSSLYREGGSPPLSARLRELSNNLKSLCTATKFKLPMTQENGNLTSHDEVAHQISEPITPIAETEPIDFATPQEKFHTCNSKLKDSFVRTHLKFLNTASKEELQRLKGIGEKRASYILELRSKSPFKNLEDLENIGLSAKQIKGMMRKTAEGLF